MPSPLPCDRFTQRLRHHMARHNIPSFTALAQKAAVSRDAIRTVRAGRAHRCQGATLYKLAIALDLSLDQLLTEFTDPPLTPANPSPDPVWQTAALQTLEPWLLQWPTVIAAVTKNPNLPAAKILPLVKPVETLLAQWGITSIAPIGSEHPYDPRRHELLQGQAPPGTPIRIRYAGYQQGETLLWRAKVSPVT